MDDHLHLALEGAIIFGYSSRSSMVRYRFAQVVRTMLQVIRIGALGSLSSLLVLAKMLAVTGCGGPDSQLRSKLASREVPVPVDNYLTASFVGKFDTLPLVNRLSLQWVDHVQQRSGQTTLESGAELRMQRHPRYPEAMALVALPVCESFPERCSWFIGLLLSSTSGGSATLG